MTKENSESQISGLLTRIDVKALSYASISAILVYLLLDAILEILIKKITGLSIISCFEQERNISFGVRFHIYNFLLFSAEILLVMFFYAIIRPAFHAKTKPVIITTLFFLVFTSLFLAQMVNLGIYPLHTAVLFIIMIAVELPVSVFLGAYRYDKMVEWE